MLPCMPLGRAELSGSSVLPWSLECEWERGWEDCDTERERELDLEREQDLKEIRYR